MNAARKEQWKQAFTFGPNDLSILGTVSIMSFVGILTYRWPKHPVFTFAIGSIVGFSLIHLIFVRAGMRRFLISLAYITGIVLCFALYMHFRP